MKQQVGRRSKRHALGVVAIAAALVPVLLAIPQFWIWNPRVDALLTEEGNRARVRTDAIMVLAYRDDRQVAGRELAEAGVSDNLVVSMSQRVERMQNPSDPLRLAEGNWFERCNTQYPSYFAWCVEPDPNDTRGEALAFAALAEREGWESVAVVTEPSHLWRATRIFGRCFPGRVYAWSSSPNHSIPWLLYRGVYEGAAIYWDELGAGAC